MPRKFRDKRLYERGRFIWARVRDEHGYIVRVATRCTDEKAAALFADEWERRAADPAYGRAATATLEVAIQDWFVELERRRLSAATRDIARIKAGHFVRLWGLEWPLLRITNDLVLKYIDTREREGVKPLTVKKELGALKGILEWAKFRGRFPRDLAEVLPPHYSGRHVPRTRAPSAEEVMRLLAALPPFRAAHIAFFCASGARRGEAQRARREDIDLANLRILIRGTKTKRAADSIPITGLTHSLAVYVLQHAPGGPGELLFKPWGNLRRDVREACARAGIDPVTPNDLRRAFGTWHRKAGATAEQVSLLLRHTTSTLAQTTYARVSATDVGDALRLLSPVPALYSAPASDSSDDPKNT